MAGGPWKYQYQVAYAGGRQQPADRDHRQKNVRLNNLDRKMLVAQGNAQKFMDFSIDLVVTNIHYDVICKVVAASGFLTKKWFVLSGILRSQFLRVMQTLGSYPVTIVKTLGK